ncbi:hypothetical protein FA95DRAFT_166981 [Auriscalpium vulgare]|uniref:Uncharacterized protein n=1 Tax=Auriscalpium vulgare TaxID=40419 RepID=A0ACB8RMK9_9AGAM|nr:hypothetical protein FA95DRAFT_166981 [Auriscalpium vulgare]
MYHYWTSAYDARSEMLDPLFEDLNPDHRGWVSNIDEEEIDAIVHVLALARSHQNATVFPTEILFIILQYLSPTQDQSISWQKHISDASCWVKQITHVCVQWRQLALSRPELWTSIDWSNLPPKWQAEMLQRSSPMLISLLIRSPVLPGPALPSYADLDFGDALGQDALCRLQHLELANIEVNVGQNRVALQNLMERQEAPLRSLAILPGPSGPERRKRLHEDFFHQTPLVLERLLLRDWLMCWNGPRLNNLVELTIEVTPIERVLGPQISSEEASGHLPSASQLAAALRGMPRLKKLSLHHTIPKATVAPPDAVKVPLPPQVIHLPALQLLKLSGLPEDCADLLSHLDLPPAVQKRINMHFSDQPGCGTRLSLSNLRSPSVPLYALRFEGPRPPLHTPGQRFTISLWANYVADLTEHNADVALDIFGVFNADPSWICRASSWEGLAMEDLTKLDVDFGDYNGNRRARWHRSHWTSAFGRARAVRTISTHGRQAADSLLNALLLPARSTEDVLFPALETLVIGELPSVLMNEEVFFNSLYELLDSRSKRGVPLHRVQFPAYHGSLTRERLARVRTAVLATGMLIE